MVSKDEKGKMTLLFPSPPKLRPPPRQPIQHHPPSPTHPTLTSYPIHICSYNKKGDCLQISLLILNKFKRLTSIPPQIIRKPKLGGIEVNEFAQICVTLEAKFGEDP